MPERLSRRAPRAAMVLLAALVTAGCLGGGAPGPRYYVITPDATTPVEHVEGDRPLRVRLGEVRLPQYLERPQIVTRTAANRLELAEYHQWGGNLRKNLAQVLARNLSRRLDTPHVSLPAAAAQDPDVVVEVTVMQFERGPDGRVLLSAGWRLLGGADRRVLDAGLSELTSPPLGAEADYDAVVTAMSGVYGRLSAEIASAIRAGVGHGG